MFSPWQWRGPGSFTVLAWIAVAWGAGARLPAQAAKARSSQSPAQASPAPASRRQRSARELKREEKQRILGVMPDFFTVNRQNVPPLSARQKFQLNFRNALDPFTFVLAGLDAGISQAQDAFPGYGQGLAGYGKRFGASYADTFDGDLWGSAILPVWLHEDPRYFRKGHGRFVSRVLFAAASTVWCRRDNGRWGPNYAYVGGNFIAGGISNIYYPASERGAGLTADRAAAVIAEGAVSAEFFEFWPNLQRRFARRRARRIGSGH